MHNKFIIQWKSRVNGRAGRGTKLFAKEEAERLAAELNQEYPQIVHEIAPAPSSATEEETAVPGVTLSFA